MPICYEYWKRKGGTEGGISLQYIIRLKAKWFKVKHSDIPKFLLFWGGDFGTGKWDSLHTLNISNYQGLGVWYQYFMRSSFIWIVCSSTLLHDRPALLIHNCGLFKMIRISIKMWPISDTLFRNFNQNVTHSKYLIY